MKAASLNHVYRVVWSHLQNAWTVVSETAKSSGKKSSVINASATSASAKALPLKLTSSTKIKLTLAAALSTLAMSNQAFALPTGAENIYGSFDSVTNGSTMTINQHTGKSIVNWQTFNIASGEAVNLLQPAGGVALYRVVGNNVSEIYGQLTASGQLFLINPNGILFGETAQVNVGSIVASSLDIKNDDFLNGRYHFTAADNAGSVINKGAIKADDEGYIVMLGKTVVNEGTLVANNGSVVLASAKEAILDFYGNGLVKARLTGEAVDALVKNSGLIQANGGFVQLATSARSAAINVSGIIEANQLVERDGVIRLEGGDNAKVQVSGQLIANGEGTTGGTIEVTGEQVALMKGALLDASGDTGGGTVMVGGDYQGKNGEVYNARTTYVAEGATIKADAIKEGNGGKVIVWADDLTRFYGKISAQAGLINGNGGFVEVSGKQDLTFMGKVDLTATNGLGGKLLLDPENINLVSTSQVPPTNNANGTPDVAFANNAGGDTFIEVSDVTGFSELFLQANNDINVSSALSMTNPAGSVRLEAKNDINVNANVAAGTIGGSVKMTADNNINVNADITSGAMGSVTLTANADNVGGGNIAIGGNITGSANVTLSAVNITHTSGNINTTGNTLIGYGGEVKINATGDVNLGNANINAFGTTIGNKGSKGGNVEITAQSLTMTGTINTKGSNAGSAVEVGGTGGKVTINTANNLRVGDINTSSGNAGIDSKVSTTSGDVQITSKSGNIFTGAINSNGGINGSGGAVLLNAAGTVTTGNINANAGTVNSGMLGVAAGNELTINAGTGITVGTIDISGANGNGINMGGGSAGAVNLKTTAGDINMAAVTNNAGTATGTGVAGGTAKVFAQAGQDVILNGDITTGSPAADAVQLVAGRNFINASDANITTGAGGRWTVYSADPTNDVKGAQLLADYDYKQYGTKFGDALLGTGNGFVHAVSPTVTATLTGTSTKVVDGNNIVTDLSGLTVATSGVLDGDKVTINPTPITSATFDNAAVGAGKPINSTFNVVSITTNEGKQIFNPTAGTLDGYTVVNAPSTATGSIVALPVTPLTISFPRDNAGLGGLIGNNPVLNSMTIVSLNPAAGDEEDLDAVACPVNEDKLGSTPILNSGVKLPNGVSSNCI